MNELQSHIARNRATYILIALLVALLVVWGIWHTVSFRLGGHGTLEVLNVPAGSVVEIDDKRVETVSAGESTIQSDVPPGNRTVTVRAVGHYPWAKTVVVEQDQTTSVTPFLVSQNPETERIIAGSEEVAQAVRAFDTLPALDRAAGITSRDSAVTAWLDGSTVYALWQGATSTLPEYFCIDSCNKTLEVLKAAQPITNLSFLGDRNDVLLLTTPDGVFALELDLRDIQNFQPVYRRRGADFRIRDARSLYLSVRDDYFVIAL
jgi:hypothetical protein